MWVSCDPPALGPPLRLVRHPFSPCPAHRPGSHMREPCHIALPSPPIALYPASRHSYLPRTVRSMVIGPTSIPRFRSPCHARFRLSTYCTSHRPAARRVRRRAVSSYPLPPFTAARFRRGRSPAACPPPLCLPRPSAPAPSGCGLPPAPELLFPKFSDNCVSLSAGWFSPLPPLLRSLPGGFPFAVVRSAAPPSAAPLLAAGDAAVRAAVRRVHPRRSG